MNSKRHSFSGLGFKEDSLFVSRRFADKFQKNDFNAINLKRYSAPAAREGAGFVVTFLVMLMLCGYWGCTLPRTENENENAFGILPANRERKAPPILGINYVETLGRTGQGPAEFRIPAGLALDGQGGIYIADAGNNRVQVIDIYGNFITEFGSHGWRIGEFDYPTDIALSFQRGYRLYVADTGNNRVQYCNLVEGIFYPLQIEPDSGGSGTRTNTQIIALERPEGIGIGRNGDVFVIDTGNHRWVQFNIQGAPVIAHGRFGIGKEHLWNATDISIDAKGNIYVVDTGNHLIKKYDFSGNCIRLWGGEGSTLGQFREPKYIAVDTWNYLYVTDSANQRIQVFTHDGKSITEFRTETLLEPTGIAVSKNGRIFVSDAAANDIKVFQVIFGRNFSDKE